MNATVVACSPQDGDALVKHTTSGHHYQAHQREAATIAQPAV